MKDFKSFYIKTYGCVMNYADSDRIRYVLQKEGLNETSKAEDASIIVLNSCSVRKQAEDKVAGWAMKKDKEEKNKNKDKDKDKDKIYILTGCMAVRHERDKNSLREKYTRMIQRKFPWIDYVVDIRDIEKLPEILEKRFEKNNSCSYLNLPTESKNSFVANIPISTGCDFFCSYCIVPYSRGKLLHRNYEDIITEVKKNISEGKTLICLVAQNVNSWEGEKKGKQIDFADLLNDVCKLDGDFWVTFVSSNPMDFSKKIISTISKNQKIIRWINIAVQSGSDGVLKSMNRRYTVKEFEGLIEEIKKEIPDIRLTTDVIVGFPNESEDDFEKTLDLVKRVKFQMVYVGKYSPRDLTASAKLEDNVSFKEKKRREDILKDEVNKMRKDFHGALVGKKLKVLSLDKNKAISYYYHEIIFEKPLPKKKIGTFLDVLVTKSTLSGLVAKC